MPPRPRPYEIQGQTVLLSRAEAEVLHVLHESGGLPVDAWEMAFQVRGAPVPQGYDSWARSRIKRLRQRLRAQGSPLHERIVTIPCIGYFLVPAGMSLDLPWQLWSRR